MIQCSDKYFDDLINHFEIRQFIEDNIDDASSDEDDDEDDICELSKAEANAMEFLFDYLIKLIRKEGVVDESDECIEYIEKAKTAAVKDGDIDEVLTQLRRAVNEMRAFDIGLFLKQYKEHEIACKRLENENVVLFIGSTGAGKSTTIYFLKGVEMERDEYDSDHIRAKDSSSNVSIMDELSNIRLEQSIRASVTSHITPVPMMLDEALKHSDVTNDNSLQKNRVIFCDTPGFGDSRGIETDISNSFGLANAMKSAHRVRIVFVISKEDVSLRMKQLKTLADNLYQYLINYESKNTNDSDSLEKKEIKQNDDTYSDNGGQDDALPVESNFSTKLSDICIIFTKFSSIKSIKELFNKKEIRKLEREYATKPKDAFYYLNKHIHKLAIDDGIILIDPVNGDHKNILSKMFSTGNGRWIETTHADFQACISPEIMLRIDKQVEEHCHYVESITNSADSIGYGVARINFDCFALVAQKLNELSELKDILRRNTIEPKLLGCINRITNQWNRICKSVIEKAIEFGENTHTDNSNNDSISISRFKMDYNGIRDYESRICDFERVFQQLLVKYDNFRINHLPNAKNKYQMLYLINKEFTTLLNNVKVKLNSESRLSVIDNIYSDESQGILQNEEYKHQPEENMMKEEIQHDDIAGNELKRKDNDIIMMNPCTTTNNLLRCLVIVACFDKNIDCGYSDMLDKHLRHMTNECIKHIKNNNTRHIVSILELLRSTIAKAVDLEIKSLQNPLQLEALNKTCNGIKQALKNEFHSQIASIDGLVNTIGNINCKNETKEQMELDQLKHEYNTVCKCCQDLEHHFIDDEIVKPDQVKEKINELLNQRCQSLQQEIETRLSDKGDTRFADIRYFIGTIDQIMKITDTEQTIDSILVKIWRHLTKPSNDLVMIIQQLKWIVKYHSSKDRWNDVFDSVLDIARKKINSLNKLIADDAGISVEHIKTSPQAVEYIVSQIVAIGRCLYDGYHDKVFHSGCDIKKVDKIVGKPIDSLRIQIEKIIEDVFGMRICQDNQDEKENKIEKTIQAEFNNEQANDCLTLLEKCRILNKDILSVFTSVQVMTVQQATMANIEYNLKQDGIARCTLVSRGLKYFEDILDNVIGNSNGKSDDVTYANDHARDIGVFDDITSILEKYKVLSKYMYVDKDIRNHITQWKSDISAIFDNLGHIICTVDNSSTIIASTMIICKALKIVDKCGILEDKKTFTLMSKKIESLIDNECKELMKLIETRNFISVSKQFEKQEKQLLAGEKFNMASECLANEMFKIAAKLTDMIKSLPMVNLNKYFDVHSPLFDQLIQQTNQIVESNLVQCINTKNKNKWNENFKQIFDRARSSSNELLKNVETLEYDKLQANVAILKDFESKMIALKRHQDMYATETIDNNLTKLIVIDKVEQRLYADCTEYGLLSIENYHLQSQPSTICKILTNAINICKLFDTESVLLQKYKQTKESIEKSFQNVFKQECDSLMQVRSKFYQHHAKVNLCKELVESLIDGNLKSNVRETLMKMTSQFNQLKKDEDNKIVATAKQDVISLMDMVWVAKDSFWGVSTHVSKLRDLCNVYQEYLPRIEYHDEIMEQTLRKILLDRIKNECKEIETCVSDNKSFNANSSNVSNLQDRMNKLKEIANKILYHDKCDTRLKSSICDIIMDSYKKCKEETKDCKDSASQQLSRMEKLRHQFAYKSWKGKQDKLVEQLATYILRLLNGLVYYCSILCNILPQTIEQIDKNSIKEQIYNLLHNVLSKWMSELKMLIANNAFNQIVPYLETISIFNNNLLMNQVQQNLGYDLNYFSCANVCSMIKKHMKTIQDEMADIKNGLWNLDGDISLGMAMRVNQCQQLKNKLKILISGCQIEKYLDGYNHRELTKSYISAIWDEVENARLTISKELGCVSIGSNSSENSFRKINHLYSNLDVLVDVRLFETYSNGLSLQQSIDSQRTSSKDEIVSTLKKIAEKASNQLPLTEIKDSMIKLQMAKHILTDTKFQNVVSQLMGKVIVQQRKICGILTLSTLFTDIDTFQSPFGHTGKDSLDTKSNDDDINGPNMDDQDANDSYWCKEIINTFPIFSGAVTHWFNTNHGQNAKDIDSAIEKMLVGKNGNDSMEDNEKNMLKLLYELFDKKYWQLINKYIIKSDIKNETDIVKKKTLEKIRSEIASVLRNRFEDYKRCDMIVELMAYIFCVWTLLDCKCFLAMKKQHDYHKSKNTNATDANQHEKPQVAALFDLETCKSYLRQPKATQILAIVRLLGTSGQMEPNLIEMKTGEGKSLVLAVSACIIALLGSNVYCTSYGELLTERDYGKFRDLFIQLNVEKKIRYTMYGTVCSELISKMNIQENVSQFLSKTCNYKSESTANDGRCDDDWTANNTVLLVDEVDVLFDKRYVGSTYNEAMILKHECISKMTDLIWNLHTSGRIDKNVEMIKNSQEYDDCRKIFGRWMPLIDVHIGNMIKDVKLVEMHDYIVCDDQIGYYKEDRISYCIHRGYKTMFAYYQQHEKGKISATALESEKSIHFRHACISYAELPCQFKCIAGVTGTLSQLEMIRKEFLQKKYNIDRYTYIPTMFTENQLHFDKTKDVAIAPTEWQQMLMTNQKIHLQRGLAGHRPILVFFQTYNQLERFYKYYYSQSDCQCLILNEELTINEKIKVVKDACRLNTVTLCTKIFGRGTDFIVTDDRVNELGGPHVIQTFFSWDISEEIQIKGRTARNGGNGSFSMVLNPIKYRYNYGYDHFYLAREKRQQESNAKFFESVKESKVYHDKTIQLTKELKQDSVDTVLKLLLDFLRM